MGQLERKILEGSGYEAWMQRREADFCDEVEPVHVDVVDGENVVWARRSGIADAGFFDIHHIGCDCLASVPHGGSEIKAMLGCKAVQTVLFETAAVAANEEFLLDQILPEFMYEEGGLLHLDAAGEDLAGVFIFDALAKTIEDPERCQGNIRAGVHVKPILQYMLAGIADYQLEMILDGLHYEGRVIHEDPVVAIAA